MAEPDVTQIVAGSGKIYIAPLGTATPIDVLPVPALPLVWIAAWKAVGYTDDGIDLTYGPTTKDIVVDEEAAPVFDILTAEKATVAVKMAEASLLNLSHAIAACTFADNSAGANKDIEVNVGSLPLSYVMVGIEGPSPFPGLTRVVIVAKAMAKGNISMKMQRKDKVVIPATFEARKLVGVSLVRIVDVTGHV